VAYALAKKNDGAPGIDGVTFDDIEKQGVEAFLEQIRDELTGRSYVPRPARRQEIPKDGGKVRVLSIPAIHGKHVSHPTLAEADNLCEDLGLSVKQRELTGLSRTIDY
jgi:hypothetical protein